MTRRKRVVFQEKLAVTADDLLHLEAELIDLIYSRRMSDNDKVCATKAIHHKLQACRVLVRAQSFLESEGDLVCQ